MKFNSNCVYFLLSIIILTVPQLVKSQSEDETNQLTNELPNLGRFSRYIKHRDRVASKHHEDIISKTHQDDLNDDEKDCDKSKEAGETLNHFGWISSILHRHDDSDGLRKVEKKKIEVDDVDDEAESDFDEREDYNADERSKVARSADASFLDPGSTEVCEDGGNCKNGNGNDRGLGFMDTASGNSKKTSNIAVKAAQEAKAAEDAQETAGKEASKQAKFQLAEKAIQAAKAAQAALSAKQSIVEELERELRESEVVVQDLSSSIQQSEANANAAMRAAQQAAAQLKMLTEAVQSSQSNLGNSEQAAQGAQQELSEKTQLLEAAKNRVEGLLRELKTARTDYANTKQAAYKAATAAKQAKTNA